MKGTFKKTVAYALSALTPVSAYAADDRYPDISEVVSELSDGYCSL